MEKERFRCKKFLLSLNREWHASIMRKKYPHLSYLARHIHSIPASEIESERVFSELNNLLTAHRTSTKPENVNQRIVIGSAENMLYKFFFKLKT